MTFAKRLLLVTLAALTLVRPAFGAPPPVNARAWLVLNASTGEVLAAHAAHARVPIASITKLMTVLVATRGRPLDTPITVDTGAAVVGESSVNLRPGERLPLRDLAQAALIQSANDAADAIADGVAGDRETFVRWMNVRAQLMGLRDTHFVRPDGLDAPGHVSSAWDVTRLAQVAMHDPFIRATVRKRSDTIVGNRTLHTWNDLLGSFPGLIGVKTGHTGGAGWCQVAAAREPGTTIYATILGSPSRSQRNDDLAALLRWGLSLYRVRRVLESGRPYALAEIGYGRAPLRLVVRKPARHAVRTRRPLVERVVAQGAVALPVRAGTRLGSVRVYDGKRLLASRPLVAERNVERPGAAARVRFYAERTVKHVWSWFT